LRVLNTFWHSTSRPAPATQRKTINALLTVLDDDEVMQAVLDLKRAQGYLPSYSDRIDHAWGARQDSHGDLPLQPTTYLRQVYLDTVVFSYHQLAYLLNVFGPDRILMGTDYPYDMAEYNPIGHIAGVDGMDETTLAQLAGGNAMRLLDR
jgi:hypothetical protein